MKRLHLIIHGKVQGVFFRASTKRTADKLGLKGWVRNNPDGTVEVMADGSEEQLQQLIGFCRNGPERAHVTEVKVEWLEPIHEFEHFVTY